MATRLSKTKLLAEPICKKKIDRFSVRYRATKLFNLLSAQKLIPEDIERYSKTELVTFYHTFKTVFLVQNEELIDYIFKLQKEKIIETVVTCLPGCILGLRF